MRQLTALLLLFMTSGCSTLSLSGGIDDEMPGAVLSELMDNLEDYKTLSTLNRAFDDAKKKTPSEREKNLIAVAADLLPCLMTELPLGSARRICTLKEDPKKYGEYTKLVSKFNRRTSEDTESIGTGFRCAIEELQGKLNSVGLDECIRELE